MEISGKGKSRKMGEMGWSSEIDEARKAGKTGDRAKRRRAQTALLAAALGFVPFAAFAQTGKTSRVGNAFAGKFSIADSVVESAPTENATKPKAASRAGFKAFLVGADDYDDAPKLACVKNDVEAFAERLIEIGFDENNVTVLKTGEKRRDDPTKANIENRFNDFVESLEPGDFVVVFMS